MAPRTLNTTIGVVATDAPLSPAGSAGGLDGSGRPGPRRPPAHPRLDGDTLFVLATSTAPLTLPSRPSL